MFVCENHTFLLKYIILGHMLSSISPVREANPGKALIQPYVSLMAISTATSTTMLTHRKSVHDPQNSQMQRAFLCTCPDTSWQQEVSSQPQLTLCSLGLL